MHNRWNNLSNHNLVISLHFFIPQTVPPHATFPNEHSAATILTHSPSVQSRPEDKGNRPSIDGRVWRRPLVICPVIMKAQLCGLSANKPSSVSALTAKRSPFRPAGSLWAVFDNAASGAIVCVVQMISSWQRTDDQRDLSEWLAL